MRSPACGQVLPATALLALITVATPVQAQTQQAACACVGQWQTTVLTAKNLALCKEVYGNKCLGAEVRITSPWTWDAARQACVGSFEYWQGIRGSTPEWQSAGTYSTQTVELSRAQQRCREIGAAVGDDPPPRRNIAPAVRAPEKLRDAVRQAMRDRPSVNQVRRTVRGADSVITVTGPGQVTETTASGDTRIPATCSLPTVIDLTALGTAMRSLGIPTEEAASIADSLTSGGDLGSDVAGAVTDRYAANTSTGFILNLLSLTLVVSSGDISLSPAVWQADVTAPSAGPLAARRIPGTGGMRYGAARASRSCEHFSIKGTINGGGDFIRAPHPPGSFTSGGRLTYIRAGAAASDAIAISSSLIAPPGAEFHLASATAAVEVAANGLSAIAVVRGRARATELVTGQSRDVSAGQIVIVAPGIGVAPPVAMPSGVRTFIDATLNGRGPDRTDTGRAPRTSDTARLADVLTGSRVLGGGEEWALRTNSGTLALFARLPWKQVAGAANALEVRVNSRLLVSPLRNKSGSFTYADGREFDYLDGKTGHWMVFYSPDFVSNNTGAGGDYQVVTDPESAYRYTWDITAFAGGGKTAEVVIRNAITSGKVPLEVSFDDPGRTGDPRTRESRTLNRESEAPWRGAKPLDEPGTPARGPDAGELTGTWTMDYWVFGYAKPREFTLQQQGPALTGTMLSAGGNPIRLEGSVSGDTLKLDFIYDSVATLSELTSPPVARKIAGIRSRAQFQRAGPDTWKGTLSNFYLSTTGEAVNASADGGTPEATKRSTPGPTTMKRTR